MDPLTSAENPSLANAATANTLTWLKAVVGAAIILPVVAFAGIAWYTHGQAIQAAELQIDRSARVAEEHARKVFETNVAMLSRILDLVGDDTPARLPAREEELHAALTNMSANLLQLQGIFLIDETGRLFASNRMQHVPRDIDYTDREFFKQHRAKPGPEPLITPLLTSRSTGELFFNMSVRRTHRNGTFGGAISTSMAPGYFHNFYRELAGGNRQLNIELVREDGAVLAAWPDAPAESGPSSTAGDTPRAIGARGVTPAKLRDGRSGLIAVHDVAPFGVRVRVWMEDPAVFAPWYRELALLGSLLVIAAVGLVTIARVALQKTQAALKAAEYLREETAQRRRVEEMLWQTQKLEALGRLTGGVAHDFNNLLSIVSNSVFLHRRAYPAAGADPALGAIERAVGTGSNLTRQLLSFSRRQPLRPESLRLQDRLPATVELLRTAVGSNITIVLSVDPATSSIFVDAAEFELALLNLAINAKDAMVTGGTLQIEAGNRGPASSDPQGDFVIIRVQDNGVGIPAALLGRVFEPLFTTKPAGQGTGLGLSQVYGFCVRANGKATVESEPGRGTTVQLLLPVASTQLAQPAGAAAAPADHMKDLQILLVEDNDEVAMATTAVLESLGSQVRRCRSAEDALVVLEVDTQAFDLMLSDIVMDGTLDGVALARRVRMLRPAMPVLLMSGYSASLSDADAHHLDVLAKPCEPAALVKAIRDALAGHRKKKPD